VAWEPVTTNCLPSDYFVHYTRQILWGADQEIRSFNSTPEEGEPTFIVPDETYEAFSKYEFTVYTATRQGSCAITSDEDRK